MTSQTYNVILNMSKICQKYESMQPIKSDKTYAEIVESVNKMLDGFVDDLARLRHLYNRMLNLRAVAHFDQYDPAAGDCIRSTRAPAYILAFNLAFKERLNKVLNDCWLNTFQKTFIGCAIEFITYGERVARYITYQNTRSCLCVLNSWGISSYYNEVEFKFGNDYVNISSLYGELARFMRGVVRDLTLNM